MDVATQADAAFSRNARLRFVIIAGIAAFYVLTIRSGHDWGDDFAQYLSHAKNIVQHRPYGETGYVYNRLNPIVGPQAYPPAFPAFLAPLYAAFGLNLFPFKLAMVALFVVTLLVTDKLFAGGLSPASRCAYLLIVGLNPTLWSYKDEIISEHLFIALWYLAIFAAHEWYDRRRTLGSATLHGILLGLLIYLAYGTRVIGLVLLPAVILGELWLAKRATRVGVTAVIVAIACIAVQKLVLPVVGGGYAQQMPANVGEVVQSVLWRIKALVLYWDNDYCKTLRNVGGLLLLIPAVAGFLRNNPWRKPSFMGLAVLGYLGVLAIWTADDKRFLVPLFPAYVFYVLSAIDSLATRRLPAARAALTAFLLFVAASYVGFYCVTPRGAMKDGVESPAAVELFAFLREKTSPDEACIFFKPRALALYAHGRASAYPAGKDERQFWEYADAIGATLLIVRATPDGPLTAEWAFAAAPPTPPTGKHHRAVAEKNRALGPSFPEIYRNSAFRVYRLAEASAPGTSVKPRGRPPAALP